MTETDATETHIDWLYVKKFLRRRAGLLLMVQSRRAPLEADDLVQFGLLRALKAVVQFDPSRGCRLVSWLCLTGLTEMRRALRDVKGLFGDAGRWAWKGCRTRELRPTVACRRLPPSAGELREEFLSSGWHEDRDPGHTEVVVRLRCDGERQVDVAEAMGLHPSRVSAITIEYRRHIRRRIAIAG